MRWIDEMVEKREKSSKLGIEERMREQRGREEKGDRRMEEEKRERIVRKKRRGERNSIKLFGRFFDTQNPDI
jgi:hypothetical protein